MIYRYFKKSAFSLIELLVVCGIIALIAGFAVPSVVGMMKGSQLTQASQTLTDQIALARQLALTKNRSVEVRFYRFGDPESPGESPDKPDEGKYRGMQLFEVSNNGAALPIGKFQRLPTGIVMSKGALSSLIEKLPERSASSASGDPELPILPGDSKWEYRIVAFRFLPDGSTDLSPVGGGSGGNWFVTIHGIEQSETLSKPPANFFTLQVDPVSGTTKAFRPTAG